MMRFAAVMLALFMQAPLAQAGSIPQSESSSITCKAATLARSGIGQSYVGDVQNSDYLLIAKIPDGFTAWDGVATGAPFHGFVIFLDQDEQACLIFDIHVRVDEDDRLAVPHNAQRLRLGHARAWTVAKHGYAEGVKITKVETSFTYTRSDQTEDGSVSLISPSSDLDRTQRIYKQFLNSLSIGN